MRKIAKMAAALGIGVSTLALTATPALAAGYHIYGTWPVNQSQSCYYAEYYHPDAPGHPDFCQVIGDQIHLFVWY
ncbi:hypothetical protein GCM10009555_093070 [Acrocarpospora macrocephala]|uniref:Uncharacterized protein n=1 Tax=Acrocarpospora macrocephala TaxID=150177 RepID=A0A5M3X1G6_9ACTN|nr:hypothetical protein [Acrocarpospora macrocephala]GES13979.1 hypothetical protein Amac_075760 [Acrocarpospora macrocephala]